MRDVDEGVVGDGLGSIDASLERLVDLDSLSAEAAEIARDRIDGTTNLADDDVVLATNTSTLSVTHIASYGPSITLYG